MELNPPLGQLLHQRGLISPEALLQVLDKAKKADKRVGEMLFALEYLNEDTFKELMRHQFREVVFDLPGWTGGDFHYQKCQVELYDLAAQDINAIQLQLESAV